MEFRGIESLRGAALCVKNNHQTKTNQKTVPSFWKMSHKYLFAMEKLSGNSRFRTRFGEYSKRFLEKPPIRGIDGERETLHDRQLLYDWVKR
jgi:hypothetical protein